MGVHVTESGNTDTKIGDEEQFLKDLIRIQALNIQMMVILTKFMDTYPWRNREGLK